MVQLKTDDKGSIITLSPNRSVNWNEIKLWLLLISIPAFIIALGWFYVGVWVILPFTGIEILLLTFFMYKVCYQNYRKEIISIEKDKVTFHSGISKPEKSYYFTRPDCYLMVKAATSPSDNVELKLASESNKFSIGNFLTTEDKEIARRYITKAGLIECSSEWWKKNSI